MQIDLNGLGVSPMAGPKGDIFAMAQEIRRAITGEQPPLYCDRVNDPNCPQGTVFKLKGPWNSWAQAAEICNVGLHEPPKGDIFKKRKVDYLGAVREVIGR